MSWLSKLGSWMGDLAKRAVKNTLVYSYNETVRLAQMISYWPKVAKVLVTGENGQKLLEGTVLSIRQNLVPFMIAGSVLQAVNAMLALPQDSEDEQETRHTALTAIWISNEVLTVLLNHYKRKMRAQHYMYAAIMENRAIAAFPADLNQTIPSCPHPGCTWKLRFMGTTKEQVILLVNELMVAMLARTPYLQGVAWFSSVYWHGRYIARLTATHCPEHRGIESEHALALGLGHEGLKWTVTSLLNNSIGFALEHVLALNFWHEGLKQVLISLLNSSKGIATDIVLELVTHSITVFQIGVASCMKVPNCPSDRQTLLFDPYATLEGFISREVHIHGDYLRQKVPQKIVEIIKNAGSDLLFVDTLPEKQNYYRYRYCYFLVQAPKKEDDPKLYYISPDAALHELVLEHPTFLLDELNAGFGSDHPARIHLTRKQVKAIITRNCGHIPANPWIELLKDLIVFFKQLHDSSIMQFLARRLFPPLITNPTQDPLVQLFFGDLGAEANGLITEYEPYFKLLQRISTNPAFEFLTASPRITADVLIANMKLTGMQLDNQDDIRQLIIVVLKTIRSDYYRWMLEWLDKCLEEHRHKQIPLIMPAPEGVLRVNLRSAEDSSHTEDLSVESLTGDSETTDQQLQEVPNQLPDNTTRDEMLGL